jgi:hypothetical protein
MGEPFLLFEQRNLPSQQSDCFWGFGFIKKGLLSEALFIFFEHGLKTAVFFIHFTTNYITATGT